MLHSIIPFVLTLLQNTYFVVNLFIAEMNRWLSVNNNKMLYACLFHHNFIILSANVKISRVSVIRYVYEFLMSMALPATNNGECVWEQC